MLESASITHVGQVRSKNEDSFVDNNELGLWVVADGVGGNAFGDFASQVTCQTVERKLRQGITLKDAIRDAHQLVIKLGAEKVEVSGMASTVVAAHFKGSQFQVCWVGDSRAYIITTPSRNQATNNDSGVKGSAQVGLNSYGSGSIEQLTTDHNHAQRLFEQGEIKAEEVRTHPSQSVLLNAVGSSSSIWKVDTIEAELKPNQIMMLCSDGLTGEIDDTDILSSFLSNESLPVIARELLDKALKCGGNDNITIVLVARDPSSVDCSASGEAVLSKYITEKIGGETKLVDGKRTDDKGTLVNYSIIKYGIAGVVFALLVIVIALWLA